MLRLVLFISSALAVGLTEATDNDDDEPYYQHVGCFKDIRRSRAMPDHLGVWNRNIAIKECAKASWKKGYKVFGVQYFGECWSGVNAALTYDKYGHSNGCSSDGVGGTWASDVYAFVFCPPGYTNAMHTATCTPCPVDTYKHNKNKCQPCGGQKKTWGRKAVANEEQCTDENPIKVPSLAAKIAPDDVTPGLIVINFTASYTSGSLVIPPLTYTITGVTKTPLQTRTTNVTSGDIESCSQPTSNTSFPFCIYKHNGSIAINKNFIYSEGDEFVISINVSDSGNDTIGKIVNPNGRVTIACLDECKDVRPLYQKARNACPKTNITVQTHKSRQEVVDTTNIHAIHEVHVTNITGNGCNNLNITIKQGLRRNQTHMVYFSDISGNQSLVYRFKNPIMVIGPVLNITLLSNGCITSSSLTLVTVPKHPENCSVTGWTCLDGVFNWTNLLDIGKCGSDPDKLRMRYGHCVVKPTIISGPASSSVSSETQVTLSCGISSPIPAKITWYRGTGEIVTSPITMNVDNQGYYWCEASNRYGTTRSRKALLVVTDHLTSLIRFKTKDSNPKNNQNKESCKPCEHISRYLSSKNASRDYKHRSTCKHWNWDRKLGVECVIYGKKKTQDEDANNYYKNLVGILKEGAHKNKIEGLKIGWKFISVKDTGMCLGETTGQPNIKGYFTWSSARIGETRTFNCPYGESSATRRCGGNFNTGAEWNTPDDDNCNYKSKKTQKLKKLSQIKLNSGNAKEVAKNFTKLFKSGSSKDMSEADANLAADMVDKILSVEDRLNETAGLVVEIIDVFMEINKLVLARSTNVTSRIIKALDKLTEKVPLEKDTTSWVLNSANLVIKALEVTRSTFKGITFGVKKNKEGSSTVIADADQSDIFVRLPSTILEKSIQSSSRIGFIYYANNKLFQPSPQDENEEAQLLSNEVISGSVYNESMQNLRDPVGLKFQVLKDSDGNPGTPTSCVFWEGHQRQWSSLGCTLHKTDDTIGNPVECHCNHTTSFSVVFAFGSVVVDTQTVTNVTVKEGEDVRINCSNNAQGEGQWKKDGSDVDLSNRIRIVDTILIITNSSMDDAGVYKCLKGKNTHIVNLRVNVTVKVMMSLRILNWNFTNEIQDKKSAEYMRFEDNFKKQMDELYKDLKGYIGVEILEILNGSVRVVFRVIVTQSISDRKETTTYKRVVITQKVIDEAKTGWVKNLQVDASPEAFKTDAPPPQPENVTLVDVTDSGAEISWDKPKNHGYYDIKGYLIEYWLFSSPNNKENLGIIKGEKTKITGLKDETAYVARIFAMNDNKGQESAAIDIKTEKAVLAGWVIALIVILCILILLIIIALIIFLCRRRKMQREKMEEDLFAMQNVNRNKVEETEKGHPILRSYTNNMYNLSNDNWTEIPRENLVLLEKIGSGEFGVVHKGQLVKDGNPTVCAVKTHKAGAGPEEYRALYEELEIMANVGNHPNLVNLIGATSKEDELFVIVEFARYGSLVKFLRSQRLKPEEKYEFDLNYMNRLRIALDVAKGMAYLQSKRCVHRDLAARNVLLADNFVAKVADFGLSRDIYETGEYEKTTRGKMPTRWMAIESLELMRFTLKSDVWSYGVLLWEIETKGLMPHGAIAYIELLEKQKKGYRLEQPNGTPDELYGLMQKCWQANPQDRPNFPEICDTLETALLKSAPDY